MVMLLVFALWLRKTEGKLDESYPLVRLFLVLFLLLVVLVVLVILALCLQRIEGHSKAYLLFLL